MNSTHCSRCVCTWMGQMQRTHFTAVYTLYKCVCDKLKKKKNGKPIYRTISRENAALRGASADGESSGCEFAQPHYLLPVCQEAGGPLTDGGGHRELCQFV